MWRNVIVLTLLPFVGLDNGFIGVATHSENKEVRVTSEAVILGFVGDYVVLQQAHHEYLLSQ